MSTIMDVAKKHDPQTVLFVGSGSCWLDINRAGYFQDENYVRKLSDDLYKKTEEPLNKLKRLYLRMTNESKTPVTRLKEAINRAQANIDNFVPLDKRPVKEVYRRFTDGGLCIVVSGDEIGKYWTPKEKYPKGMPYWKGEEKEYERNIV